MTFIQDQVNRPITAGIFNFMGQYGTKWSYLTAFAVVTIIPVALIFIFMQKYIISGLTAGAVKGKAERAVPKKSGNFLRSL